MARKTSKPKTKPAASSPKKAAPESRPKPAPSQVNAASRKARATAVKMTALTAGQPIPKSFARVSFRQPTPAEVTYGQSLGTKAQEALKKARQARA